MFSININQPPGETNRASHTFTSCSHVIETNKNESLVSDKLTHIIRRIEKRKHLWSADNVRKESSPMISAKLNSEKCTPTIDEGSEVNCIDTAFAKKCKVLGVPTQCSARAAGNTAMMVSGQTQNNVVLEIPNRDSLVTWDLSRCIIVDNLGVDILIGEPGKIDNKIVTNSQVKHVETEDVNGNAVCIPYFKRKDEKRFLCRATKSETLLPGEDIHLNLPPHLWNEEFVAVAPAIETKIDFVTPQIRKVGADRIIKIKNKTETPVFVGKNWCVADITAMKEMRIDKVCTKSSDKSHLLKPAIFSKSEAGKSYTDEVLIDPDDQLAKVWKERFRITCDRFCDVINPNPGRYNNYYGDVDCSIDFCSTPPPSVKA